MGYALAVLLLCTLALAWPRVAEAATITVSNTNNSGAGSLRQAITDAVAGDTINFSVTGTITLTSGELTVNKNLTITGPGASSLTISGNNASRVFNISAGTVSISGLAISGGNTASDGGGIFNLGTLTITNSTVSGNTAANVGGGIANYGTLTVTNCTISNNTAIGGGGIYNNFTKTATVSGSTISSNTGTSGGGIENSGSITIINSTISGNTTDSDGGGILNTSVGTCSVSASTISGNTASGSGGAVRNGGTISFTSSTISSNSANNGGGIHIYGTGTATLANTIFSDNTASVNPQCFGTITSNDYNLIENTSNCTIAGTTTNNVYGQDPALGALQNNGGSTFTHALTSGSPAIDRGSCAAGTDQRGQARPIGSACDIGAYEVSTTQTLTVAKSGTGIGTVTSNMGGISCGATCSKAYGQGASVTLTATASTGSGFMGWSGGGCSGTGTCTVSVTAATTVTATFDTCAYGINPTSVTPTAAGATGSIVAVTTTPNQSTCTWSATANDGWLTVTAGTPGAGNGTVTYDVAANAGAARTGTITIAGKTFTVDQANGCTFASIVPGTDSYTATGGSGSFTVTTSDSSCVWTATSNDAWVTVTSGGAGTTNHSTSPGTVIDPFSVGAITSDIVVPLGGSISDLNLSLNISHSFVGDLSVKLKHIDSNTEVTVIDRIGRIIPFNPSGCTGSNIVTTIDDEAASPVANACPPTAGPYTPNNPLSAFDGEDAAGTWRLTVTDNVNGDGGTFNSWAMAIETDSPNVQYDVDGNTSAAARTGTVTVEITGLPATATDFTVGQDGCIYNVTPLSQAVPFAGGAGYSVDVTTDATTCQWSATEAETWLSITAGAGPNTGDGTVTYDVAANAAAARSGTLTVAGETVTVNQDVAVYTLTAAKDGTGTGTVTANAGAINCGGTCSDDYDYNTTVTLTATADNGSAFMGWAGCDSVAGNDCTVAVTAARSVTATFDTCTYGIAPTSANVAYTGATGNTVAVTTTPDQPTCTWTAVANDGWITITGGTPGAGSGTLTYDVAANAAAARTGTMTIAGEIFTVNQAVAIYTLTAAKDGAGTGTVTASAGAINCGGTCADSYDYDTSVTLTATPDAGTFFLGWSGGGCAGNGTCTVNVTSDITVTAAFSSCAYSISPISTIAPLEGLTGATVSVTAIPNVPSCTWNAVSNAPWVTVTGGSSGIGSGTVTYKVDANADGARRGYITIAGLQFRVSQPSALCDYQIAPASASYGYAGGQGEVWMNYAGNCQVDAGLVESHNDWLQVTGAQGNTVSYQVLANPTGRPRTGTILIANTDFIVTQGAGEQSLPMEGNTVDFGLVLVGSTASTTLTITNNGTGPVDVWIDGIAGSGEFSYSTTCDTVLPQDSCTLTIIYDPSSIGPKTATLMLVMDGQGYPIMLSGQGVLSGVPDIRVSPTSLYFTDQELEQGLTSKAVTITNRGDATLVVRRTQLLGPNVGEFSVTNNCTDIEAGESCNETLSIQRTSDAPMWASLSVQSNDPDRPAVEVPVSVEGQAGCQGAIAIDPMSIEVGPDGQSGSFSVTAPEGCWWLARSGKQWITVDAQWQQGSATVQYTVGGNPWEAARLGHVMVGGNDVLVLQYATGQEDAAFDDLPVEQWTHVYIEALHAAGLVNGCGQGLFCSEENITREQAIAFVIKALEGHPDEDYCQSGTPFTDVPAERWSCRYVKRAKELGLTKGCGGGLFCPEEELKRDQMAALVARALVGDGFSYEGGQYFMDLSPDMWAYDYAHKLWELGYVKGCDEGQFCSELSIQRKYMAVLFGRIFLGMQ